VAVKGYEGLYAISDHGRVLSFHTNRMPVFHVSRAGYLSVQLCNKPVRPKLKRKYVHSLVAEAFIGSRPEGMQVNHKDGVKANNHWTNLEYVTPLENTRHAAKIGNAPKVRKGEGVPWSKLTEDQVRAIRNEYVPWVVSLSMLAKKYGVKPMAIYGVVRRFNWRHID
jgi:hypothetical protein